MRQQLRSRLTYANVISTLALFLVLGGGTTLAATGGNFILGQSNSASSTTSLTAPVAGKGLQVTNTSTGTGATALGLNVASGHPPFTVNSGTKVANLNADKLDGKDSSAFSTNGARKFVYDQPGSFTIPFPITTILTLNEMTLKAACANQDRTDVFLHVSSTVDAYLNYSYLDGDNDNTPTPVAKGTIISAGGDVVPVQGNPLPADTWRRFEGQLVYRNATRVITVTFHVIANDGANRCQVEGTAVQAPN